MRQDALPPQLLTTGNVAKDRAPPWRLVEKEFVWIDLDKRFDAWPCFWTINERENTAISLLPMRG